MKAANSSKLEKPNLHPANLAQEIYDDLGQLVLSDPQPDHGSRHSIPTALADPVQEPATVFNLQLAIGTRKDQVLETARTKEP